MNTALIALKLRKGEAKGHFEIPIVVPLLGCLVCAALIVSRLGSAAAGTRAPLIAMLLLGMIAVLYFVMRPKDPVAVAD
jgi:basic amino acid/polyamine antiporter, APA family